MDLRTTLPDSSILLDYLTTSNLFLILVLRSFIGLNVKVKEEKSRELHGRRAIVTGKGRIRNSNIASIDRLVGRFVASL